MSKEPNDATDTERDINGVKYVGKTATIITDWRGFSAPSCDGCAGATCTERSVCSQLPNCRGYDRPDGRDLIFVSQTKEQTNG